MGSAGVEKVDTLSISLLLFLFLCFVSLFYGFVLWICFVDSFLAFRSGVFFFFLLFLWFVVFQARPAYDAFRTVIFLLIST